MGLCGKLLGHTRNSDSWSPHAHTMAKYVSGKNIRSISGQRSMRKHYPHNHLVIFIASSSTVHECLRTNSIFLESFDL